MRQNTTRRLDFVIVGLSIYAALGAVGRIIVVGSTIEILSIVEAAMFTILAIVVAFRGDEHPLAGIIVTALVIIGYGLVMIARIVSFHQIDMVAPFNTRNIAAVIAVSVVVWLFLVAYLVKQSISRARITPVRSALRPSDPGSSELPRRR